ncbi:GGDEF domain-containing protein [uncultured Selenomonas sp.]|uniref:GGDEF domain-containing protein n=1 Tax=uncultured Selenomonas sp. TaxID=159275 RepID=UPI0025D5BA98|nr:GGDEF domain-containing protein [uncultured Selenomonas sp.]
MKSNENESGDRLTPQEKVYPLNFLCRYVMARRSELEDFETQELKETIHVTEMLQGILHQMVEQCAGKDSVSVEDVLDARISLEKILATLQEHRQHLTRKGLIFEDMNNMLQQAEPLIHRLLFFDNLVNAYNRYFYVSYSSELFHRAGERGGLSMAFFDIDNFKQYNTDFGHETGDKVLQTVCDIIQRRIHTTEGLYLIRMGGDEFVILDDGVVDYDAFLRLLTEIRQAIASDRSIYGRSVTISIGASNAIADDAESTWDVYQHADARLYVAKNHGKNQIVSVG